MWWSFLPVRRVTAALVSMISARTRSMWGLTADGGLRGRAWKPVAGAARTAAAANLVVGGQAVGQI
jgi:hypothetical protein